MAQVTWFTKEIIWKLIDRSKENTCPGEKSLWNEGEIKQLEAELRMKVLETGGSRVEGIITARNEG